MFPKMNDEMTSDAITEILKTMLLFIVSLLIKADAARKQNMITEAEIIL